MWWERVATKKTSLKHCIISARAYAGDEWMDGAIRHCPLLFVHFWNRHFASDLNSEITISLEGRSSCPSPSGWALATTSVLFTFSKYVLWYYIYSIYIELVWIYWVSMLNRLRLQSQEIFKFQTVIPCIAYWDLWVSSIYMKYHTYMN